MPRFTYGGGAEQVFPQYLDTATGRTLVAAPGESYDVAVVAGQTVPDGEGGMVELKLPMPPTDDFKPAKASAQQSKES